MNSARRFLHLPVPLLAAMLLSACEPSNAPGQLHCISVETAAGPRILGIDDRYLDSEIWDEHFYLSFHWKNLSPHRGLGYNLDNTAHLQVFRHAPPDVAGAEDFTLSGLNKLVERPELKGWSKFMSIHSGSITYVPGSKAPHIHEVLCNPDSTDCVIFLRTPIFTGAVEIPKERIGEAKSFADRTEEMVERFRRAAMTSCQMDFTEEGKRSGV